MTSTPRLSPFQRLLIGEGVSNFGSMLSRVVIPWLATLALAATPFELGLLSVADVLAGAAGTVLLGATVDRASKRAAMLYADLARAALMAVLVALTIAHALALWAVVLAAAVSGLLTVTFELARSAWMARHVPSGQLARGNAQMSVAGSIAETLAFALGGWLYQWLGAALALALDAFSYLASATCVRGLAPDTATSARRHRGIGAGLVAEARAGVRMIAAKPVLRVLATLEVLTALGTSLAATSYMIYVARDLALSTGILGTIFACGGAGALAGAALAPRIGGALGHGGAIAGGLLMLALGAACIPIANGSTPLIAIALLITHQVVGDAGRAAFDVHDRTLRQTSVEMPAVARVDAGIRTLGQVATLVGALAGGLFANHYGARSALVVSATLFGVAALVAAFNSARLAGDLPRAMPGNRALRRSRVR